MHRLTFPIIGLFVFFLSTSLSAIDPPTKVNKTTISNFVAFELSNSIYRNAVYQNNDNSKVFVDFNEIPVNLKCIQVMDFEGNILFVQNVYDLSVSSLFEIDLSDIKASDYILEIQTFTNSRFIQLGGRE